MILAKFCGWSYDSSWIVGAVLFNVAFLDTSFKYNTVKYQLLLTGVRVAHRFWYEESWEETHYCVTEAWHYEGHLKRTTCWNEQHAKVSVVEHGTEHCEEIPKYFVYRPIETDCWICDYYKYAYLKKYIRNFNDHLPQKDRKYIWSYEII